jgi:hypothetical protein
MKTTMLSSISSAAISILVILIVSGLAPNAVVHRLGGVTRAEFEQLRDNAVKKSEQYFIELGPTIRMTYIPMPEGAVHCTNIDTNARWSFIPVPKKWEQGCCGTIQSSPLPLPIEVFSDNTPPHQKSRPPFHWHAGKYTGTAQTILSSAENGLSNKESIKLVARIAPTGQVVLLEGAMEFAAGTLLPDGTLDIRLHGKRKVLTTTIHGARIQFTVNSQPNLLDEGGNELDPVMHTVYTLTRVR